MPVRFCLSFLLLNVWFLALAGDNVEIVEPRAVTDPAELTALGYPADAKNIFLMPQSEQEVTPTDRSAPTSRGIIQQYWTAAGSDFLPVRSGLQYEKGPDSLMPAGSLVNLTSNGAYESQVRLPHGVIVTDMDIFGFHNTTGNLVVSFLARCLIGNPGSPSSPNETILTTQSIGTQGGNFIIWHTLASPATINNDICTYHIRANFGANGTDMQLYKAGILYETTSPTIFHDRFQNAF
jgi:hypothetical protein